MRLGFGLATLALLTAILPLFRVILDWRIILGLSLIYPVYYALINRNTILSYLKSDQLKKDIKPSVAIIIVFVLFAFTFFMYHEGAFSYPYLENDDPWNHASSIKYIAMEKTVYEPTPSTHVFDYLDARPPAYDGILGILHQTSPSLSWTMKFFNALIISLGLLFFFYFARRLFRGDSSKALLATFFLSMFPTYLTHFIWAHSLVMTLIFIGLYTLFRINSTWSSRIISAIAISAVFVTQETQSIKYVVILGLFFLSGSIVLKKINWPVVQVIFGSGLLAAIVWWIPIQKLVFF